LNVKVSTQRAIEGPIFNAIFAWDYAHEPSFPSSIQGKLAVTVSGWRLASNDSSSWFTGGAISLSAADALRSRLSVMEPI
jgi:hypothetical protein